MQVSVKQWLMTREPHLESSAIVTTHIYTLWEDIPTTHSMLSRKWSLEMIWRTMMMMTMIVKLRDARTKVFTIAIFLFKFWKQKKCRDTSINTTLPFHPLAPTTLSSVPPILPHSASDDASANQDRNNWVHFPTETRTEYWGQRKTWKTWWTWWAPSWQTWPQ